MTATSYKVPAINLLGRKQGTFLERITNWALTFGRFIIIATETVALVAFLYRFSLDRQIIDLNDQIAHQRTIVASLKNSEDKYRNFQDRLSLIVKLEKATGKTTTLFNDITSKAPPDVAFDTVTIVQNSLRIDARTQSIASLVNFITSLTKNPLVTSVSVDRIENRTANAIIRVNITAILKPLDQSIQGQ